MRDRQRAEIRQRRGEQARADRRVTGRSRPRGDRHDDEMAGDGVELDFRLDAVERADVGAGVSTSPVGPAASTCPSFSSTSDAAQAGGEVQVVRRDDDRERHLALQIAKQRRDLELIGEVERRRRLVEQQHRADVALGPVGEICASAAAMMTRCFSPPLSVANGRSSNAAVPVAASAGARDRQIARAPRSRTRRDADSGPSTTTSSTV